MPQLSIDPAGIRFHVDHRRTLLDAASMDDLSHLSWPFFDSSFIEFAQGFDRWVGAELGGFEPDEGGDGKAARQIFQRFATAGWLRNTLPTQISGRAM